MLLAYKSELKRERKNEKGRTGYLRILGQFQKYKIHVMYNRGKKAENQKKKKSNYG